MNGEESLKGTEETKDGGIRTEEQVFSPQILANQEFEESMHLTVFDKSHMEVQQQAVIDALKIECAETIEKMKIENKVKITQMESELEM